MAPEYNHALIVGAGRGLSASLARALASDGLKVSLAARNAEKLAGVAEEIGATAHTADVADPGSVSALFDTLDAGGAPDVVVYNPSYRTRGPIIDLDPDEVLKTLVISAHGGFLVAQQAAKRMLPQSRGAILFTGASASVKGYAHSAPFAMGKFALRGLAQSLARELQPKGIHVAHFVIDGGIQDPSRGRTPPAASPDSMLHPDAIAATYVATLNQDRTAWSTEVELRPWVERF